MRGPLGPRRPVPLAERVHRLARLERGLAGEYAFTRVATDFRRQAYAWEVHVTVPVYEDGYLLLIELDERRQVRVTVKGWHGPMRHTYGRDRLCMWHPKDPPHRQWSQADGLLTLVDTARVHLFKELYHRDTGEWLGEEVHHDSEARDGATLGQAA